jgi:kynurenine formamidase
VVSNGICITDFSPTELIFTKPVVVDLRIEDAGIVMPELLEAEKGRLRKADIGIFRFGCGSLRRSDPLRYAERCPGFGVESAGWIRENCPSLRAIGFDVPSVATIAHLDSTMVAHNILLEGKDRRFLIFEEMNLERELGGLLEIRVNPWLVKGMDSGPCSIVGVLEET